MGEALDTSIIEGRNILVVDDHKNIRLSLQVSLEAEKARIVEAGSVSEGSKKWALSKEAGTPFDAILLDVRLPDGNGLDFLSSLAAEGAAGKVVMISGEGTVADAFKATQMGAFDYIEKPFTPERILVSISRLFSFDQMKQDNQLLAKEALKGKEILGESDAIKSVLKTVSRVAPTNGRVLIVGESGTGKELVARAIHRESKRSRSNLVKVNCAAIPKNLIESELFGHEKGAFTGALKARKGVFERANGGTLFLDEVGELELDVQAKLLRVLQSGELNRVGSESTYQVDVRLICATNRDLEEMVKSGTFREDLYYRLNVVNVRVPPLRERLDDVRAMALKFLEQACEENSLGTRSFTEQALLRLEHHNWPGNVRELKNFVERVAILSESPVIDELDGLPNKRAQNLESNESNLDGLEPGFIEFGNNILTWQEFQQQAGRAYIKHILKLSGGNVSEAARNLCLERAYLHRLMRKLNIQRGVVVSD